MANWPPCAYSPYDTGSSLSRCRRLKKLAKFQLGMIKPKLSYPALSALQHAVKSRYDKNRVPSRRVYRGRRMSGRRSLGCKVAHSSRTSWCSVRTASRCRCGGWQRRRRRRRAEGRTAMGDFSSSAPLSTGTDAGYSHHTVNLLPHSQLTSSLTSITLHLFRYCRPFMHSHVCPIACCL